MIGDGAIQMYEQIDIDGGVVIALGDAITLLPGGNPIMFFGSFVKDDNVFIAGIVPGHEANVSFELLHAPAQLARLSEADATKEEGRTAFARLPSFAEPEPGVRRLVCHTAPSESHRAI